MPVDVVYSPTEPKTPGYRVLGSYALVDEEEQAIMTAWVREQIRERHKVGQARHSGRRGKARNGARRTA